MGLRIGHCLLEVVAIDKLGGDANFGLLVDVGHQQVELMQVSLAETAAEGVDDLLLLELPWDDLDLGEEVDCLVETSLVGDGGEEVSEWCVPTGDHN
jgi:hypothetical protein